jgi:hypothetical protein
MSGEFLDGPRRRATHRQVRTERVTKSMYAALRELRLSDRSSNMFRSSSRLARPPKRSLHKWRLIGDARQLDGDAHAVACLADAAIQRMRDMQHPSDLRQITLSRGF